MFIDTALLTSGFRRPRRAGVLSGWRPVTFVPLGALCALAIAALLGAGWRVAARTGSTGLERAMATAVLAGAAAVIEALALGLVGLGSSPVMLPLAAGPTWWVARRNLPTRGRGRGPSSRRGGGG